MVLRAVLSQKQTRTTILATLDGYAPYFSSRSQGFDRPVLPVLFLDSYTPGFPRYFENVVYYSSSRIAPSIRDFRILHALDSRVRK